MFERIKTILTVKLIHRIKILINKNYREFQNESIRIKNIPRFTETSLYFLGKEIRIVDIASFNFLKLELFEHQIYKFKCDTETPYIIDCGANIGLSIIYFKLLFPKAEIIAFEPD